MNSRFCAATFKALTVCAVAFIAAFASSPASALDGPGIAANAKRSVEAFAAYMQETTKAHGRPDYSKPPVSDYLQHILDTDGFAALPPPQAKDVPWLLDWNDSVNRAFKMMMFFGATSEADMRRAMALNLAENEQGIMRAMALEVRLGTRMIQTMPLFMAALPPEPPSKTEIRKAGVKRAERGLVETVQGASTSLTGPMRPANALLLAAALRDTAPVWAPLATSSERAQLLKIFKKAADANAYPGVVDALNKASATVSSVTN
ncbi:MAG TPA: hypothetical protein VFA57_00895 [Pseudolabrys sp.]|nr:hypothetical protein [Pseudolabrys sp.]